MKHIVILISGTGSNMAAIVQAAERERWAERLGARVVAVISNRPQAPGLALARDAGLATQVVDHRPTPAARRSTPPWATRSSSTTPRWSCWPASCAS